MTFEIKDNCVWFFDSYDYKESIKTIFGRQFISKEKAWTIPYTTEAVTKANSLMNISIPLPKLDQRGKIKPLTDFYIPNLYAHQKETISKGKSIHSIADLSEPGTGKTLSAIELFLQHNKFPVLVVCPKSIMHEVWEKEINKVNLGLSDQVIPACMPTGTQKIKELLKSIYSANHNRFIIIINYDSVVACIRELMLFEWGVVILDESTRIKNPKAQRSKAILQLRERATHTHIMTGTLAPNGLIDAYNQIRFVAPEVVGSSFYAFRYHYYTQNPFNEYQWDLKPGSAERFNRLIAPISIQHKKRDCVDLPPLVEEVRVFDLSPPVKKAYKSMREEALAVIRDMEENQEKVLVAPFKITEIMKCRQICSGFAIFTQEETITQIHPNSKMYELIELIEDIGQKTIVFCHFRESMRQVYASLKESNINALVYDDEKKRKEVLNLFEKEDKWKVLIANPASAGHGLNLQFCSNIIYYELDFNLENYLQSMDRINRIGQKNKMTIYYLLASGTIERQIYNKLKNKENLNKKLDVSKLKDLI